MKKILLTLLTTVLSTTLFAQVRLPNTLSKTEKVYGLSKFWQEVNYNFVYLDKVDRKHWESEYIRLIDAVQETENDYEYYRLLQKFCAILKDGHTGIYLPESIDSLIDSNSFGNYRLRLENIDGKAIVTGINTNKKEEVPIGSEILSVNGIPVPKYAEEFVRPYISSSTDYILEDKIFSRLLQSPLGTSFELTLKRPDNSIYDLHLTRQKSEDDQMHPPVAKQELLELKWIDSETAYLALNSFGYPEIDSLFLEKLPELKKAKKMVIDLRRNGGGNTDIGTFILQYLTNDDQLQSSVSQSRLHIPAYKAWGMWVKPADTISVKGEDRNWEKQALLSYQDQYMHEFANDPTPTEPLQSERLVIPTVLLIGNHTASAAEDFLIAADNQEHMTLIGEPTYGSTGQPMIFELPGGGAARVCTKKDTYPDGREFVGVGIQPDIYVTKTVADFMKDRDPELEKAISYLKAIPFAKSDY
ncbi:S41 family peptidase [Robertkochia aurantiaca]|uniref:S41 family peptidase n=1 Tax=Robertkochia aurantiaca TaxID=2873700 RepID=UPI001CCB887C|nr:S41 family peptidase [Robertkochia sp. 3YJGBD-33]